MDAATFLGKRGTVTEGESSGVVTITSAGEGTTRQDARGSQASLPPGPASTSAPSVTVHRDTTPSGLVIEYIPEQWVGKLKTKREYRVDGVTVPSVTTVLDILSKPGLSWWGMKIGVEGVLELFKRDRIGERLIWQDGGKELVVYSGDLPVTATTEHIVHELTLEKLTVNHTLTKAGDRGTNVHSALEDWATSGGEFFPTPAEFPDEERPYVEALLQWIDALDGAYSIVATERMVGSAEYGFAGRFDLILNLLEPRQFVRKHYKRKDSVKFPLKKGHYRIDLKTSSGVYRSHRLQLAGYEVASIESGYPPVDGGLILRVDKEGFYEFVPSEASGEDFLAVKQAYDRLEGLPK